MNVLLKDGRTALLFTGRKDTPQWLPERYVWASIAGGQFQPMRKAKIKKDKKS